jgi:ribosomal protein L9
MSPAISTLSTASQPASTQAATAIYGSVTAADILSSIMALLNMKATGEYEDAARVVLAPEDIHIIQAEATDFSEIGKIKALGEYEIHILVRGEEPIRRKIRVEAQK